MAINFERFFDVVAKILCLVVVLVQSAVLDSYFFVLDHSGVSPYVWVVLDVLILICWALSMLLPRCSRALQPRGQGLRYWALVVIREFKYAYLSWIFYAVVLCFKLNHMFFYFAERLPQGMTLTSSTSLKLLISLAGIAFLLLVYSHHREIKEENYRQVMEKISLSACLDILDCLMLLNLLFVNNDGIILPYPLDKTVRAFAFICILLPVFPLLVLRVLQHPTASLKWYKLSLILQTALYFLLVNIPLFSIRLHLWIKHFADISTFFTKNVIMLFKGAVDIAREAYDWYKFSQGTQKEGKEDSDEGRGHMLEDATLGVGGGTSGDGDMGNDDVDTNL